MHESSDTCPHTSLGPWIFFDMDMYIHSYVCVCTYVWMYVYTYGILLKVKFS
jgi:hypothetical protein